MPEPATSGELRVLVDMWSGHPSKLIDQGAIQHLGTYFAEEVPAERWHKEAERLTGRVRDVLTVADPEQSAAAREERVRSILLHAEIFATDEVEARAARAKKPTGDHGSAPAVERLSDVLLRVVDNAQHPEEAIGTPFPGLDHLLLGGFRAGELIYLGARPGMGKSAFALEVMRHVARKGRAVLFVTREMSLEALGRRAVAQDGRLDAASLRTGRRVDWRAVTETVQGLYALPVYLTQKACTVPEIFEATKEIPALALVIVDYLQLLQAPKEIKDRRLQVEHLSSALKHMAVHCSVPVLALSSLSRPDSKSKDKPPTMASLRDSGALDHDADTILLLHRKPKEQATQCLVVKNRDALVGVVELMFRPESVGFDEVMGAEEERRYDPQPNRVATLPGIVT